MIWLAPAELRNKTLSDDALSLSVSGFGTEIHLLENIYDTNDASITYHMSIMLFQAKAQIDITVAMGLSTCVIMA